MIQSEEFANLTNYPIMQPPFTTVPTAANPNYPIMQPPFVTVPTAANPTMTMQAPIRPDLTLPPMMTSRQQRIMEDPFSPSIFLLNATINPIHQRRSTPTTGIKTVKAHHGLT